MNAIPNNETDRLFAGCKPGSLIGALHARWEAIWETHGKIEGAHLETDDALEEILLTGAMRDVTAEADLIQRSLLLQPPRDDADLAILAFHAANIADAGTSRSQDGRDALEQGTRAIFDYLVGQGRIDMHAAGTAFSEEGRRVHTILNRRWNGEAE